MALTSLARTVIPLAGVAVMLIVPLDVDWHARASLAIATGMVLGWVTEVLHPAILGFVGCFLFRVAGGVEFETAFAGFGTVTPWFLYAALLLIGATRRSGLLAALGRAVPAPLASSVPAASVLLIAVSYGLALIVPSSLARAIVLIALAGIIAPRAGSRAAAGTLAVVAAYSAAMFGHRDLPAGPLSIIGWDVAAAAALAGAAMMLMWGTPAPQPPDAEDSAPERADTDTWVAAVPLALAAALWVTTPWHGLSPALVGLGCGLLCGVPGLARRDGSKVMDADHLAVIFCGAALSIPAVLTDTKAAGALAHLWSDAGGTSAGVLGYWATVFYRMFSPDDARVALPSLAWALHSPALWSYAGSTLLSIHQSPALILGWSVARIRPTQVFVIGLAVLVLGSVVVLVY